MTPPEHRTISVIGATGTIGRLLIARLADQPDVIVRAASRKDQPTSSEVGLRWARFDWEAPTGASAVVAGVDALFILPPPARHPVATTTVLLDRAAEAGLGHVVFFSSLGADATPGFAFGRWALKAEAVVAASGLPYTVLRPNSFMTNFLTTQRPAPDGPLRLPWGSAANSFVDPRDIAEVAARVLLKPKVHTGATYQLTGPAALDLDEVAALLSEVSGEPISYQPPPPELVRNALASQGIPGALVDAFMELHAFMASGIRSIVTDDVRRVAGRPARSFAQFAAEHADVWRQRNRAATASAGTR